MISSKEITISERFDDRYGRLRGYDCHDVDQREQLRKQEHLDVRCMRSLSAGYYDEGWTGENFTLYGYFGVPAMELATGVSPTTAYAESDVTVNFSGVPSNWSLSIPIIYQELGFLSAGMYVNGDFWISFMDSADPREFTMSMAELASLDEEIRSIRIEIEHTEDNAKLILGPIRFLSPDWKYAPLDINTLTRTVGPSAPRDIASLGSYDFPANLISDPLVPNDFPILLRSDSAVGANDPKPIDISEAIIFSPGSLNGDGEIRAYLREGSFDNITMLDLDNWNGNDGGITMAQLDALGAQPDFGLARWAARTQDDLNGLLQDELDGQPQWALGTKPDLFTASWIQVRLRWQSDTTATVEARDTDGNVYPFPQFNVPAIADGDDERLIFLVELHESSLRVRVIETTTESLQGSVLFDSTLVTDTSVFRRLSGRVGWYANLNDHDAYIQDILAFNLNFAEYRSQPFRSISPVSGAQVFFGGSPDRELFTEYIAHGGRLAPTTEQVAATGDTYKVSPVGGNSALRTNIFDLVSPRNTRASVDVYIPAESEAAELSVDLYRYNHGALGEQSFSLNVGRVPTETWHTLQFDLTDLDHALLPGNCYFVVRLGEVDDAVGYSFYVANFSIAHAPLEWSARAVAVDPWGDDTADWFPLREHVNSQTAGVLFDRPGHELQARCIANRQDAQLTSVKLIPHKAQPGRLVWRDIGIDPVSFTPTPEFTTTTAGRKVTCFAYNSAFGSTTRAIQRVGLLTWDYGDGTTLYGIQPSHTYADAGTYTITLTVNYYDGTYATRSHEVTVS